MAIPSIQSFLHPVLQYLNNIAKPISKKDILSDIKVILNFSEDELNERTKTGRLRVEDRIEYALVDLKRAELIENTSRGIYIITDSGKIFLQENPNFRLMELKRLTPYLKNKQSTSNFFDTTNTEEPTESQEIEFDLEKTLDDHFVDIQFTLLEKLLSMDDNYQKGQLFERICLRLFSKIMHCEGELCGGSGDGGVDVKLHLDIFKFNSVGIQCKCTKNTISAKEINHLRGGLEEHDLNRGIFVTTSKFSKDAIEKTNTINKKDINIVLIDGLELTKLMMEYEIGIEKQILYKYELNLDSLIQKISTSI